MKQLTLHSLILLAIAIPTFAQQTPPAAATPQGLGAADLLIVGIVMRSCLVLVAHNAAKFFRDAWVSSLRLFRSCLDYKLAKCFCFCGFD